MCHVTEKKLECKEKRFSIEKNQYILKKYFYAYPKKKAKDGCSVELPSALIQHWK